MYFPRTWFESDSEPPLEVVSESDGFRIRPPESAGRLPSGGNTPDYMNRAIRRIPLQH